MSQKILAAHAGLDSVSAGQLIEANLDWLILQTIGVDVIKRDAAIKIAFHDIERGADDVLLDAKPFGDSAGKGRFPGSEISFEQNHVARNEKAGKRKAKPRGFFFRGGVIISYRISVMVHHCYSFKQPDMLSMVFLRPAFLGNREIGGQEFLEQPFDFGVHEREDMGIHHGPDVFRGLLDDFA